MTDRLPAVLRESPDFRRFFAGQAVSLVGDQITLIALPLVAVLVLHANAAEMGYLTAAAFLPYLVLAVHAGAWLDRHGGRRRAMLTADLARAAVIASVPAAYAVGALGLPQLYAVAFLEGAFSCVFFVAYSTLFVAIVPRERYLEANSLLHGSRAVSFVAGPSLGGAIVQAVSGPAALVVDAVSFLVSATSLARIQAPEPPTEEAEHGHVVAGARWIVRSPEIRSALGATAIVNFFNFVFSAIFILFATRALGVAPGTLGAVLGAAAVGGVVGSVVATPISRRIGVGRAFALGCFLFPAATALVPLAGGPHWLVLACLFAAELGSAVGVVLLDIAAGTIFAVLIPDRLRARVSGAYTMVNYGVRPAGALAGGLLGSTLGLRPALWISTVGGLTATAWLVRSPLRRLHALPGGEEPATA